MTRARLRQDGECWELELQGHAVSEAGPEPDGPRVCAAVSGLVYALAGYLRHGQSRGFAQVDELELGSGWARFRCRGDRRVGAAFELTEIGLRQLSGGYPRLIQVAEEETA